MTNPELRVLVTGGGGFIGANLVRMLLGRGDAVTVLDDWSVGSKEQLADLDVGSIDGDILDRDVVEEAVRGHDAVVHLAAQTGVPGSLQDPRKDCEVNVIGTLNLLEAARDHDIRRFVFASSNAPLGRQDPPATEDKAPLPISPYGASKLAGEAYCLAFHGSFGLGTVALRFGNVYGPYCGHKNSVVAKFLKDIIARGEVTIDGDGRQTRDFIFVGDLARAILAGLDGDVGGEVFQISTGTETSIADLAKLVEKTVGKPLAIDFGPGRSGDMERNYALVAKAERLLGWRPEIDLEEGLRATWEWIRDHGGVTREATDLMGDV